MSTVLMIEDVRIDSELRALLPSLTEEEQRHLREAVNEFSTDDQ